MPKFDYLKAARFSKAPEQTALSFGLAIALLSQSSACQAADFSQSKRTYVPPSLIERRVDFSTVREGQALDDQSGSAVVDQSVTRPLTATINASRYRPPSSVKPYGQLPPPPQAVAPSDDQIVPPPPPYTSSSLAKPVAYKPLANSASLTKTAQNIQAQLKQVASSPQVQAAFQNLKRKAEDYVRSGKLPEAKHAVAQALKLTPHDKSLIRELGAISIQRAQQFSQGQDFDKAIKFARQALVFDGSSNDARNLLNGLLEKTGVNPADVAVRLQSANLLASQGLNDEAAVEYQAAEQIKPSADAMVGLGNLSVRAGQTDLAKTNYKKAMEIDPKSASAHRQLGMLKLSKGDIVAANSELSRALVIDPKDTEAAKSLVELWQQQVSKVPGANSHLGLARAYQLEGDLASAQVEYRTVVQMDPGNPHLPAARQSFKMALSHQESDQDFQAAQSLESQGAVVEAYHKTYEAVGLSPRDANLRIYLGHLLERMQKYPEAYEAYQTALKVDPHNQAAAARISSLPPEARQPAIPGTGTAAGDQSLLASMMQGSSAPPPLQIPTSDGVTNLSNFAVALRNQMFIQKSQVEQIEDNARRMLSKIGAPPAPMLPDPGAGKPSTLASGSTSLPVDLAAALADDPSATPVTPNLPEGMSNDISSTLAKAKAAIAAAKGLKAPPAVAASAAPKSAPLARAVPAATKAPVATPAATPPVYSPAPAADTNSPIVSSDVTRTFADASPTINQAASIDPFGAQGIAPSALPAYAATQAEIEPPLAPNLRGMIPATATAPAVAPGIGMPAGGGSSVSFELASVNPHATGVDLNVVLRNYADSPLSIPGKTKAVIKYSNRKDASVKMTFEQAEVPPHSQVKGVIRVPYSQADPNADLIIPGLLPGGVAGGDVHLVTNLAAR